MKMKKKRKNPYLNPNKRRSRKNLLRGGLKSQYPRKKRLRLLIRRRRKSSLMMRAKMMIKVNSKNRRRKRNSQSLAVALRLAMKLVNVISANRRSLRRRQSRNRHNLSVISAKNNSRPGMHCSLILRRLVMLELCEIKVIVIYNIIC